MEPLRHRIRPLNALQYSLNNNITLPFTLLLPVVQQHLTNLSPLGNEKLLYNFFSNPTIPNSHRLLPPWAIPSAGELPGTNRLSPFVYQWKGHTLDGSEGGGEKETIVLSPSYCLRDREVGFKVTNRLPEGEVPKRGMERVLEVPEVRSFGRLNVEDSEMKDTLEFRNLNQGERRGQAELTVATTKKTLWTDDLPNWIIACAGSQYLTAIGCEDGSSITSSPAGRRLMPTLILDSPLSFLVAEETFLLGLTALRTLTFRNLSPTIPRPRSIYPPLNISSLLSSFSSLKDLTPSITSSSTQWNTSHRSLPGSTFSHDQDPQS